MPRRALIAVTIVLLVAGCGGDKTRAMSDGVTTTVPGTPTGGGVDAGGATASDPANPGGTGGGGTGGSSGTRGGRSGSGGGGSTASTRGGGSPAPTATGGGDGGSTPGGAPVPDTSPTTTKAQQQDLDAQLADAVKITPLDGFDETPPPANGLGALDLEGASGGDQAERDALATAGFRRGYARGWTKQSEDLTTIVYQLGSAAQADAYLRDTVELAIKGNGSATFDPGVPGATGYREQATDASGQQYIAWGAVFVRGDRFYEQILRGPRDGSTRVEADARDLCRRQAERVGG